MIWVTEIDSSDIVVACMSSVNACYHGDYVTVVLLYEVVDTSSLIAGYMHGSFGHFTHS